MSSKKSTHYINIDAHKHTGTTHIDTHTWPRQREGTLIQTKP